MENVHSVFLWPKINNLSGCVIERVAKNQTQVCGNSGTCPNRRPFGGVRNSEENWSLIFEPVEWVKSSKGTEDVLGVEGEWVSKEEIWSFFNRNSSQGIEPALVSLLKLLGECLVGSECSVSHLVNNTQRRWHNHWCEECWDFTIVIVFETTEVSWPSRVSLSEEGDFGSNIKEGGGNYSLGSVFETSLIWFEIEGLFDKNFSLIQVCWWFIMLKHQPSVFHKVIEILLNTAGEQSNSDTWNTKNGQYLVGSSSWEWNHEQGPTW